LITKEHIPQIPSRQSWSNATGSSLRAIRLSLTMSSISKNEASAGMSFALYSANRPWAVAFFWRHTRRV